MSYLDELAEDLHEVSRANGFYDGELTYDKIFAKVAFLSEEVGELIHAIKKDKGAQEVSDELADLIIRALDLHECLHRADLATDSIHEALLAKHEKNKSRGHLHGNVAG